MTPSMEFDFFASAVHWVDIFIELATSVQVWGDKEGVMGDSGWDSIWCQDTPTHTSNIPFFPPIWPIPPPPADLPMLAGPFLAVAMHWLCSNITQGKGTNIPFNLILLLYAHLQILPE